VHPLVEKQSGEKAKRTFHHLIALFCTVSGKEVHARGALQIFAMKSMT
jgi:hypothetical protein